MDEFHSSWVSDIYGWINFIHEQWAKLYMKIVVVLVLHHSLFSLCRCWFSTLQSFSKLGKNAERVWIHSVSSIVALGFDQVVPLQGFLFMIWLTKCKRTSQAALESYMFKQRQNQTTDSHGTWHRICSVEGSSCYN